MNWARSLGVPGRRSGYGRTGRRSHQAGCGNRKSPAAVEQSVFFIPIVTPRAVNSNYCKFEFEAFLARERALGRADLVFPILYVPVPALQTRRNGATIPCFRRSPSGNMSIGRPSVIPTLIRPPCGRRLGAFASRSSRRCIIHGNRRRNASSARRPQPSSDEDQRRQQEAETKRHAEEDARRTKDEADAQRIAEERKQQDTEAKRRADEAGRHKRAEAEARQRAQEERLGRDVEAKQRADLLKVIVALALLGLVGLLFYISSGTFD